MSSTTKRLPMACIMTMLVFGSSPYSARAGEKTEVKQGPWRAWLDSPGGDLPFDLALRQDHADWRATITNGKDTIDVPVVELNDETLTLGIDYYDSTIRADVSNNGTRLDGEWKKKGRGKEWSSLPFHAEAGQRPRFDSRLAAKPPERTGIAKDISGRWSVKFDSSDDPAIGVFEQGERGIVSGTFLTSTGDYGFLAGLYEDGLLRLSGFDGAHAFLFHAKCQPDGTLLGDFWSRDTWHETWIARPDLHAALPDAFAMTKPTGRVDLSQLRFPDVYGKEHALSDSAFAGKAYIIDIFGTWCPNCYDASNYLEELYAKHKSRGLSIVGLAFELTGDFNRDARQVKRYVARHKIAYPVLVAGEAVREKVAERVPIIDKMRAYPTLIFIDASGEIRGIYTGFSGPATGEAYANLRRDIEKLVESLLDE